MGGFLGFLTDYYIVDSWIVIMGLFGLFVMVDRAKALFFDLALDTTTFMNQIMGFMREDKVEQAISFCAANEKKPLAHVLKRILEKSGYDYSELAHAYDTASTEVAPSLVKRLGHLSMIANVATLVGLLGTVVGLIMSFKAVSFADVSQRQALLVDGISLAMHATAMGLLVAIPVMVVYSFLHDKQSKLFADIDRSASQLMEFIRLRDIMPATTTNVYPEHHNNGKAPAAPKSSPIPPPPKSKAS